MCTLVMMGCAFEQIMTTMMLRIVKNYSRIRSNRLISHTEGVEVQHYKTIFMYMNVKRQEFGPNQ